VGAKGRYVEGMLSLALKLLKHAAPARWAGILLLVSAGCLLAVSPARAFDLFATHEVTAQFATADGKPMANATVRVFAPGDPRTPLETGRTDSQGKFVFDADSDGMWSAEARTSTEVARVMIRVGAGEQQTQQSRVPPFVVIGGLVALVALAWWYRILRGRARRREP
jgi:hypothetical protein